mmetsp:Transcript_88125/g.248776  ORF Transcript_88125/g.248776 Transcript_88125/m.248776 type:complete len:201 (-) Transcript_88125:321-923(-)
MPLKTGRAAALGTECHLGLASVDEHGEAERKGVSLLEVLQAEAQRAVLQEQSDAEVVQRKLNIRGCILTKPNLLHGLERHCPRAGILLAGAGQRQGGKLPVQGHHALGEAARDREHGDGLALHHGANEVLHNRLRLADVDVRRHLRRRRRCGARGALEVAAAGLGGGPGRGGGEARPGRGGREGEGDAVSVALGSTRYLM